MMVADFFKNVELGNIKILLHILRRIDASRNLADKDGTTALEVVIKKKGLDDADEVVKELLKMKGPPVKESGRADWTTLHIASKQGHVDVIAWLLASGADIYRRTGDGDTALDIATNKAVIAELKKGGCFDAFCSNIYSAVSPFCQTTYTHCCLSVVLFYILLYQCAAIRIPKTLRYVPVFITNVLTKRYLAAKGDRITGSRGDDDKHGRLMPKVIGADHNNDNRAVFFIKSDGDDYHKIENKETLRWLFDDGRGICMASDQNYIGSAMWKIEKLEGDEYVFISRSTNGYMYVDGLTDGRHRGADRGLGFGSDIKITTNKNNPGTKWIITKDLPFPERFRETISIEGGGRRVIKRVGTATRGPESEF